MNGEEILKISDAVLYQGFQRDIYLLVNGGPYVSLSGRHNQKSMQVYIQADVHRDTIYLQVLQLCLKKETEQGCILFCFHWPKPDVSEVQ